MDEYAGSETAPGPVILRPKGIFHGQTTFRRRVVDGLVGRALMAIQAEPGIDLLSLCERLGCARATLDARFRRMAGMTAAKAIEIERFNRAKALLRGTGYGLEAVASLAGYPNRRGMRRSFQRFAKTTPRQFRELNGTRKAG